MSSNCIQEFVTLSSTNHIRTITLMKDDDNQQFFRKTSSERWIKCNAKYQKQLISDQKRLILFMNKNRLLLDIEISSEEEESEEVHNSSEDDVQMELP